jgi:transcriptional regulator GlxA family with amidase domain
MKVNIILFDDFDAMDAFVPAEVFGKLPEHFYVEYYSLKGDFVRSLQGAKVWTEYMDESLKGDILIIPGGKGARRAIRGDESLCRLLKKIVERHSFCAMFGSGIFLLAQTGVLYRRRVCDYPMDDNWNRMFTAAVYRTEDTRWAADGKFYSASSPVAGIDMCLNLLADLTDLDLAFKIAAELGYAWDPDEEEGIYR